MTVPPENQPFEQIIHKFSPGSKLRRTWPLNGGMSAAMTALEMESPAGETRRVIVRQPGAATLRQNPQAAQVEFTLLQRLQSLGLPTQTPYLLDSSGEIFSTPYLMLEYIEGKPQYAPADLGDYLLQFAALLARIHRIDGARPDYSFLSEHTGRCTEISDESLANAEDMFEEGPIRDTLAACSPLPSRNAPALLHGDFWPGNLLWQKEHLVAVIDWEDARIGDPLIDFAISRLDILCIFGIEALHTFSHHYQAQMTLDYTPLPYWDLCAALRLLRLSSSNLAAWAVFYPPVGRPDITEHTLSEHLRFFIHQALEEVSARP